METPLPSIAAEEKQSRFRESWEKLLRNSIPERIYLEDVSCKLVVRRCILEYEQILIVGQRGFWMVPPPDEEEFRSQLKSSLVQNALYDLAIISLDVDQYENLIIDKVRSYMERLVGLSDVESLRGKGFVQDYYHFPVATSLRMSLRQKFQLMKYLWDDPLTFFQGGLTYLMKLRESNRLERMIYAKFKGGYKMRREEGLEEHLELHVQKMYSKFKHINRSVSRDPLLRLPDLVGQMRFYITNEVALPVLQRCKRKISYTRNTRKDIQKRWRDLDETTMSPGGKAERERNGVDFLDLLCSYVFMSGCIENLPPAIYCAACTGLSHFGYPPTTPTPPNGKGFVCTAAERDCSNFFWELFRLCFLLAVVYYGAKSMIKFLVRMLRSLLYK